MSKDRVYKVGDVIEVFAHGDDAKEFWLRRYKMKGYLFDLIDSDTHGMKLKVNGILPEATEEDRLKLVQDFLILAIKINGGFVRRNGKGHPTAFFDYSGHVNVLYIRIYEDGWSSDHSYDDSVVKYNIDFDDDRFLVFGREVYKELCDKFLENESEVTCYQMLIASQVTEENVDKAKQTVKEVADYIVDAAKEIEGKDE